LVEAFAVEINQPGGSLTVEIEQPGGSLTVEIEQPGGSLTVEIEYPAGDLGSGSVHLLTVLALPKFAFGR
jgi:diaminopimelate epimerase